MDTGVPAWQVPKRHVSPVVQTFPATHDVPSGAAGFEHVPATGSQVPAWWQASDAVQTTGAEPTHAPAWQASVWVHAFPSLQAVPFDAAGLEQVPVAESQVPTVWHWSLAAQVTGLPPTHEPLWHVSLSVQAFPSLQPAPLVTAGFEHAPVIESQIPAAWH
jgi:hypothetical protein